MYIELNSMYISDILAQEEAIQWPPRPSEATSTILAFQHPALATVSRFCQLPGARGCLLRLAGPRRPTSTSRLLPIEYA
jgi:hypothetical protein